MKSEKELLQLKKNIDTAKTKAAEIKGQISANMKALRNNWECDSIEETKKLRSQLRQDRDAKSKRLSENIRVLEEKLK